MEFQNTSMEKSWEIFLSCTMHPPPQKKKNCTARTCTYDDNEMGVVCSIFRGEGVTKRGDVEATVIKSKMIYH